MNIFIADQKIISNPGRLNCSYTEENLINTMLVCMGTFSLMSKDKNIRYEKGFGYKRFKHALSVLDNEKIKSKDLIIEFIDNNNKNHKLSLLNLAIELKKYNTAILLIKSGHIPQNLASTLQRINIKDENLNNHDYSFQNFYVKYFYSQFSDEDKKIVSDKINKSFDIKSIHFILKNHNEDAHFRIDQNTVAHIEKLLMDANSKKYRRNKVVLEETFLLCQKSFLNIMLNETNIQKEKTIRL